MYEQFYNNYRSLTNKHCEWKPPHSKNIWHRKLGRVISPLNDCIPRILIMLWRVSLCRRHQHCHIYLRVARSTMSTIYTKQQQYNNNNNNNNKYLWSKWTHQSSSDEAHDSRIMSDVNFQIFASSRATCTHLTIINMIGSTSLT